MSNAIEHFSRTRVENTTLQVIADRQRDLDCLLGEEETVIRHYIEHGAWPHKLVNMFVFENLEPLVAQIKSAAVLPSVVAEDIDRRPMVNIYDAADLTECTIFVNRRALEKDGVWNDAIALRALLAHEHGHPLAENETVRVARELSVEVTAESPTAIAAIVGILHLLADRLCVHAPQEVFANEIAIRAGFGDALLHLDRGAVEKARLGVTKRGSLAQGLDELAKVGRLSPLQVAALLLVGDMQAHLGFVLEISAFLRAEQRQQAQLLEGALIDGVLARLDPAVLPLYEKFRGHYLRLRFDFTPAEMTAWSNEALAFLSESLGERNLQIRFSVIGARSEERLQRASPAHRMPVVRSSIEHDGGSP